MRTIESVMMAEITKEKSTPNITHPCAETLGLNLGQRTKRGFSFRDLDLRWIVPSRIREHDCVPVSGGAGGGKINTTNTFCW